MATLRIDNGRILDGTGAEPFDAHLLIEGDTIRDIVRGDGERPPADHVIDAAGQVVSPGFIDMHSHFDFILPTANHADNARSFLEQGVTTVVTGNCGISPAPIREETRQHLEDFSSIAIDDPLDWGWSSFGEYMDALRERGVALNVAQLVGHASVRYAASDTLRGDLSPKDLDRCRALVEEAFARGACGLSFGLGYDPGMHSSLSELEAFARVAAKHDRMLTVHLKAYARMGPTYPPTADYGRHNVRALREMLELADRAEVRLQVSHLMFAGRKSWPSARRLIEMIDAERARGRDVMFDAFPYTCGNTTINVLLPDWFHGMGPDRFRSRWARMSIRAQFALAFHLIGWGWDDIQIMSVGVEEWEALNGKTIAEISRGWGMSPFDTYMKIAEDTNGGALTLFHGLSGDRQDNGPLNDVITHEACLYETDAVVRDRSWPNPATVGTFPKVLARWVRERNEITLPAAVHRMTGASAGRFGLDDRGVIAEGKKADLVVFDPETIADDPGGPDAPPGRPHGIQSVIVNGHEVVRDGALQDGPHRGRVLGI